MSSLPKYGNVDKWCVKHKRYYNFVCPPCSQEKRDQQELDDARAEMIFREEQIHNELARGNDRLAGLLAVPYGEARDRYLALLAEDRIRKLREVTA